MRIPHTISKNIFKAYKCSTESTLLPYEQRRNIRSEDFKWDKGIVPELKILALNVIASTWKNKPILDELPSCMDRIFLLETLPTNLPFELTISNISDEHYWERAAKDRWSYNNPIDHGKSWRRLYCERHLAEYLENFEASYFESQKDECIKLVKLVSEHVRILKLRALKPTKKASTTLSIDGPDSNDDDDVVEHIPMSIILPQLPHLTEMSLNIGMIYLNDGFEWRDFQFSVQDCSNLGEGLKACSNLRKFSLTRSNLDRVRVATILQKLIRNKNIKELDFSHCKLGDSGAQAVAEFLSLHGQLQVLHLANNNIGENGVSGIVYSLLKKNETSLRHLNLRLNPLGDAGGSHICALLLRNNHVEILNVSSCELSSDIGEAIAEIFESTDINVTSLEIDLSNNNFGPIVGKMFEKVIQTNKNIFKLDTRMCNFTKESEYSIWKSILRRNKKKRGKDRASLSISQRGTTLRSLSPSKYLQEEKGKEKEDIVLAEDETATIKTILPPRIYSEPIFEEN
ncbi:PREDICTED: T-complex-associated testis-expressed protein 1-like [Polistes dominula]|uniref:T-complex-associated testis-expressed protein 1-like n=1 Tax=Polistes dominula TaxID=743375 RepID=A0ABM1J4M8_POLDO|nr:PREDICTED: T-complex-associated testis-expressed protein 1-like [Polistes dominula]